mmetsp:Transcript_18290/g.28102  ORF Transcript_18290/g.28102 Transcript_18290/m.28102 type:complete len:820 (-) Transcript_18290:1271-3730(-)
MRVFLPAALQNQQQQQQQQQQHQVYSPSTSSVETALVCNKSNNKKKAHQEGGNFDEEGDDFSLSHSHEQDCTLDLADTTADTATKSTAIGDESEAKRPASLLAPPPSNNNNSSNNDNGDSPLILDDRKIAAKKEGEDNCYLVQPKLKKARVQHNNLEQRFIPSLKSCQEEGDDDWKQSNQFAAAVAASSTTKAVHNNNNMGGGGKLISGPPPSNAPSSLRQASNNSNVVGVAAAASIGGRGGIERNQQQQIMMVGPSVAAAAASSYHQRRRGEERVASATTTAAAASMPLSLSAASRGPNVASAASFPQPHDDDNEVGDEWNDNNNSGGKQHASSSASSGTIFINPPNNNNNSSRRGGYKTSSSPRSSTSAVAAVSALASNTAPLLNRPIPGSIDDPATMSKSDIIFLPSSSSTTSDGGGEGSTVVYEDPILNQFVQVLRTHKPPLEMVEMEGDGNCLFRAISLQVYGDQGMHAEVRKNCLDFMQKDTSHFQDFVADEPFHQYIARKRLIGVHGNHTEIQAMSELYNRSIEVFVPPKGITPINIFHEEYYKNNDADPPIRLCYMDGNHYNAIIDPLVPTAGLGLGLPGLQPGLADKLQMEQAKHASNESALDEKMQLALKESNRAQKEREEREMKEVLTKSALSMDDAYQKKALYLSEIEAADFDLEQAVLASSMESYRNAEQERKPSSRRLDSRRNRFNSSPRGQRSSSSSPIHRSNSPIAAASSASSTSQFAAVAAAAAASSTVASYSRSSPPNVASAASIGGGAGGIASSSSDEYPASVQELVMNGFELQKVLRAYDLIGDNFDDLLSFLLSQTSS